MKKVAILLANGYEESETLTIVDILRRAEIICDMFSTGDLMITGSHNITVLADKLINDEIQDYDMIVFPGGLPGATNLASDERVLNLVKYFNQEQKLIAAICAGPLVLAAADIIKERTITAYLGYDQKVGACNFKEDIVVVDDNIITSRGPATTYTFAYKLIDVLGFDSEDVKQRMVYRNAFNAE